MRRFPRIDLRTAGFSSPHAYWSSLLHLPGAARAHSSQGPPQARKAPWLCLHSGTSFSLHPFCMYPTRNENNNNKSQQSFHEICLILILLCVITTTLTCLQDMLMLTHRSSRCQTSPLAALCKQISSFLNRHSATALARAVGTAASCCVHAACCLPLQGISSTNSSTWHQQSHSLLPSSVTHQLFSHSHLALCKPLSSNESINIHIHIHVHIHTPIPQTST